MSPLLDKLIPFKKESNHSISEAIFTIFLPNRFFELIKFKTLIEENGKLENVFQHFKILEGVQFNINLTETPSPHHTKTGDDGFQMERFSNGELEWIIRYQPNNQGLNLLTIHSLNYKGWSDFYKTIFKYLSFINEIDSNIYVSGYAISYVDQFDWIDSQHPPVALIFKKTSQYLPKSIFDSKENWNQVSNFDSDLHQKSIKQHINIGSRKISENLYNIYLMHVSNLLFSEIESLDNFCKSDNAKKIFATELHDLNKVFLKDCLDDTILKSIGVIIQ